MLETEELEVGKERLLELITDFFLNKIDVKSKNFVFFSLTYIVGQPVLNDAGIGLCN